MRIKISLTFNGNLRLPIHHQELLHGLIYHSIRDEKYRNQLHNHGFEHGKRQFRMFCYSKLFGNHTLEHPFIIFCSSVSFIFSTHDERLVRELTSSLFTKDLQLGNYYVRLHSIEQISEHLSDDMLIRFITPVTVYSTFTLNNRKKTYFFAPSEPEFNEQISANARKKYEAIYGQPPTDAENRLELLPAVSQTIRSRSVLFKKTLIKGWVGDFYLRGDPELIRVVYDVGIGAKNSNSMGLFRILRPMNEMEVTYA